MADITSPPAVPSAPSEEKSSGSADATTATAPAPSTDITGEDTPAVDAADPIPAAHVTTDPSKEANDTTLADNVTTPLNGTADSKKKEKRKSTGAVVSEHKNKKLNRKKSMAVLHLDVQPGEYWYVTMKGYQAWPAIICDEEMLPESLLSKRPVSAMRPDGTYREDYADGGKNIRDRRYPVMFLGTNEFAWQVNTDLTPLNMTELKEIVEKKEQGKKSKVLWSAFEIAAEEHDLNYFKEMLVEHERRVIQELQEYEAAEMKREEEAEAAKKAKRKGAAAASEDAEMEDATGDGPKKSKKSNKRKAPKEGEAPETANVPKKIKFKKVGEPAEKEVTKPKKAKPVKTEATALPLAAPRVEETLTPAERFEKKQKTILYLRHKLQKGFLSRDQTPKSDEMPTMSEHLSQLETHTDLEPAIIKATKINKVLKGMVRLALIPREEEFNFKRRSEELLAVWNKFLSTDGDTTPAAAPAAVTEPSTNGVANGEKETVPEAPAESTSADAKSLEPETKVNGDVAMEDAPATKEPEPATEGAAVVT